MGPDPHFKYIVSAMVIFNIVSSYYIGKLPLVWILVLAYTLGGVINHSLTLAIHDISHNVVFGNYYPTANRLFGMWANLPIGVPMSISFKKYHVEHHRYQSTDFYDVDLPTRFEGVFFRNIPLKILWIFLQPFFYSLRPFIVRPKPPTTLELLNVAVQHYMYAKGYETYSYYGVWNLLTFNVGYHMEHHDFPYIPGSRLPEVKRIAAEFYDVLPHHTSWLKVLWDFVFDKEMGPFARVKRNYDDVFGENSKCNPYLHADNTMVPILGKPEGLDRKCALDGQTDSVENKASTENETDHEKAD
eukprot:Em0019g119a